ncbi:MAG TPA: transaldolase family protein, partial [Candidatus Saccharimonadales bacterium]|nr:transaldolase family protein [Candidatus Saccharimonadales bacterium]
MKPADLTTKIFLDSGDPAETKAIIGLLGFLDGQTTNPTLVAKNPYAKDRFEKGEKFNADEIIDFYKQVVTEISKLIPQGSVSIEVHAEQDTTAEDMFEQAKKMNAWIPNAHIKYPTTAEGLKAAKQSVEQNINVNMTLCFTQDQAAAVYAATKGA